MGTDCKHLSPHWTDTQRGRLSFTCHQQEDGQKTDRREGPFYLWTGRASGWLIKLFHLLFLLRFLVFHPTFFFYFCFLLFTFLNLQDNPFIVKGVHFGQSGNWNIQSQVNENTVPGNVQATTDTLSALPGSVEEHLHHCRVLNIFRSCPETQWPKYPKKPLPLFTRLLHLSYRYPLQSAPQTPSPRRGKRLSQFEAVRF